MDEDRTHRIGAHTCSFEPPDVFHVRVVGNVSPTDFEGISQVAWMYSAKADHLLWLVDLTLAGHIEPEARQLLAQQASPSWNWGGAVFGLGGPQRVLLRMVQRAAALLGAPWAPTGFCADEAEARAWIAAERRRRMALRSTG